MKPVRTCLWFEKDGLEAAELYTSLVPNSRIVGTFRAPADNPSSGEGAVLTVDFELNGTPYLILIGGPHFKLSEAASIVLECESQEEVDRYWSALTADGGQESQCGWLKDKFGVSWQITPTRLLELNASKEPGVAKRVFEAMMTMRKIDIAALEAAAAG